MERVPQDVGQCMRRPFDPEEIPSWGYGEEPWGGIIPENSIFIGNIGGSSNAMPHLLKRRVPFREIPLTIRDYVSNFGIPREASSGKRSLGVQIDWSGAWGEPKIIPKRSTQTIPHLRFKPTFAPLTSLKDFTPRPRRIRRNRDLPKRSGLDKVSVDPFNPKGVSGRDNMP